MTDKTLAWAIAEIEARKTRRREASKYWLEKARTTPRWKLRGAHRAESSWHFEEGSAQALEMALSILAQIDA